ADRVAKRATQIRLQLRRLIDTHLSKQAATRAVGAGTSTKQPGTSAKQPGTSTKQPGTGAKS
ncbi:MAG: hypothetical protein MI861_10485, partial [Pirellulales bacterium]|nr:hypothetical protein [Pirellulales bacterium]